MFFKSNLLLLWHRTYTSYWFIPLVMSLVGIGLPYLTVQYDLELRDSFFTRSLAWLNFTDRDVAHQLLTTVISSIINVISITFSLTMVVLTMAASQYGPQVLRNFMEDTSTKFVLGTFVSTFLYCLLTLRILGSIDATAPVPFINVALALVFTMLAVGVLVFFIHHVSQRVQVDVIIKQLSKELLQAIDKLFPSKVGLQPEENAQAKKWQPDTAPVAITTPVGGYVQSISGDDMLQQASQNNCVVEVLAKPGDFVVPGATLALIHQDQGGSTGTLSDKDRECLGKLFAIGARRTPIQDIEYTLEKISEIALRALSPGVNEPFVAIKCVDYLSLAMAELSNREPPDSRRVDSDGNLRIVVSPVGFEALLHGAFDPVVHYAGSDVNVMQSVIKAIGAIWSQNRNHSHNPVLEAYLAQLEQVIAGRQWEASQQNQLKDALHGIQAAQTPGQDT